MDSVFDREFLYKTADVPLTGFKDKPINRLATLKQTPSVLTIEANHLKRDFPKDTRDIVPLLEYQLWLEAGKLDKANLRSVYADTNVNINSNMWRNFCSSVGIVQRGVLSSSSKTTPTPHRKEAAASTTTTTSMGGKSPRTKPQHHHHHHQLDHHHQQQRITDAVATLYPINVPMPSRLGSNTLSKYYEQNKRHLFANDKTFSIARERVEREDARMRLLRLKSEMRNPPVDWQGNILPPSSYKKFAPTPSASQSRQKTATSEMSLPNVTARAMSTLANKRDAANTSMSGGVESGNSGVLLNANNYESSRPLSVKKRAPVLKKLVYRQNHPDFNQVIKEQQLKKTPVKSL